MRIAVATCREADGARASDVPLLAALRARGCDAEHVVWNEVGVRWEGFDACVVRSTWDWQYHAADFERWIERVAGCSRLMNAAEVLRWGLDKRYLLELERSGVPVVPTMCVAEADRPRMSALCAERGWSRVVIKPSLGATAYRTMLLEQRDADSWAREHADWAGVAIVQEYLPSIERVGEVSLVCIGGEVMHAVRKRPREGDFRSQREYGGSTERVESEEAERDVACACLAALPAEAAYARIDLIRDGAGLPRVIECEVVEPELYLDLTPRAAERLAEVVIRAADPRGERGTVR